MATPYSARYMLDLGIKCDEADLTDGDVVVVGGICPYAGTIKAVWAGVRVLITTGTLAVAKSAAANVSVLAATLTLDAATTTLVAHTASSLTLSTNTQALRVAAGDILVATWTLTDITATDDAGYSCVVVIEPDLW